MNSLDENSTVCKEFNKLPVIDGTQLVLAWQTSHEHYDQEMVSFSLKSRMSFLHPCITRGVPRIFLEGQNSSSGLKFAENLIFDIY